MIKILSFLRIHQEISNKDRSPKLGRGFSIAHRINPLNPLSYIALIIIGIIGIIVFGIVGFWQKFDRNPLKWD